MSNPFDYIKRDSEQKERRAAQREDKRRKKAEEKCERHKKVFVESVLQYDDMVVSLLEALRGVAYPAAKVTKPDIDSFFSKMDGNPEWCIGYEWVRQTESSDGTEFHTHVKITLEINNNNLPIKFICWRDNYKKTSSRLSEKHLLAALKKLHPIGK
jgi:hypothetical protein